MANSKSPTWRNWAGTVAVRPEHAVAPASVEGVRAAVRAAAEDGLTVKAVGAGHSFTAVGATEGVLLSLRRLTGVRHVDRAAGTVTVAAGTPLRELNAALTHAGLSLTNMGDIAVQTVAGAIGTGTHGTGRDSAALAAQVRGLELVTADGSLLTCSATRHPEVFAAARVGLGALGVVTAVEFAVEPLFLLRACEEPMRLDRVTADFDAFATENEHFEFYWFPHTDRCVTKRNNRAPGPARPLGLVGGWVDDELLSNGLFQVVSSLGRALPATVPAIAAVSSRALSARTYTDIPHRVFTSPRRVRFVEMEYALPRAAVVPALRELKAMVDRSRLRVGFPVEVRVAPADDIPLSTASGRDSGYIAVHMYRGTPYRAYFAAAERIFTAYGGRPHWGKLHTRRAAGLAASYPDFGAFTAVRDRLDPERRFANAYLRRVLGD
ncbi:D-arabinono-1,4-lactone oxidase [Streptomyces sp. NPDC050560]|uniref:D-arabinono-1,4-lactone oxidase n=1 Tax=Streptomyces sp. NPDC050560 TaxID=3365630 RepID=UPI00378A01CE